MTSVGVSIVVPVYNSTDSLTQLVDRLVRSLEAVRPFEIILVDDGSSRQTWSVVQSLAQKDSRVIGLRLSRNFGQHNALIAGVREASLPVTVTLDDDLQNAPEDVDSLVVRLVSGTHDVVYGVAQDVAQPWTRRMASRLVRLTLARGLGVRSAPNVSSFRAFFTSSREAFDSDLGPSVSLDALLTWSNANFDSIPVRHYERSYGKSNYTFGRLLSFGFDTLTGYSVKPLQIASLIGAGTSFFGFLLLLYVVARPLLTGTSVPGFPFLASSITFFSGVQLLTLGILGEYLSRMHFRIMRKPTYVVSEICREG